MFVRMADLVAPHLRNAFLPFLNDRRPAARRRESHKCLSDRRFAVNPASRQRSLPKLSRQPVNSK